MSGLLRFSAAPPFRTKKSAPFNFLVMSLMVYVLRLDHVPVSNPSEFGDRCQLIVLLCCFSCATKTFIKSSDLIYPTAKEPL
jgi:hypothetical protein